MAPPRGISSVILHKSIGWSCHHHEAFNLISIWFGAATTSITQVILKPFEMTSQLKVESRKHIFRWSKQLTRNILSMTSADAMFLFNDYDVIHINAFKANLITYTWLCVWYMQNAKVHCWIKHFNCIQFAQSNFINIFRFGESCLIAIAWSHAT